MDHPALLIIDMVKDNFIDDLHLPITPLARKIVGPINRLSTFFRQKDWPVVFSTDAFNEKDFIFTGRMPPHSLAGTEGAEIVDDLVRKEQDYWLPKPRFSAFFKTGLENWLRERKVSMCVVTGIATHFCVLTTAMDALCHDFKTVIVEDCSTAPTLEMHRQVLGTYRRNPLYPLLRVMTAAELMESMPG